MTKQERINFYKFHQGNAEHLITAGKLIADGTMKLTHKDQAQVFGAVTNYIGILMRAYTQTQIEYLEEQTDEQVQVDYNHVWQ